MNPKNREKLLICLLPAILILGLYSFKLSDLRARTTASQSALATAEKAVPGPQQLAAEQTRLAEVSREMAEIEKQSAQWQTRWRDLQTQRSPDSTSRIAAIESLTSLLNDHQLELVDAGTADSGDSSKLPAALDKVAKQLAESEASLSTHLWRIKFVGHYRDVLAALDELNQTQPLVIPVHLQMSEANLDSASRVWTLYMWI